ncbi:MAG: alkyl hydroperoxide reductase AhpD [Nitrospinaceae bacterium]|nr:MAG: alkyl hydroperoxide reductase AhpD [Nitrospinaceae bacterium]
MFRIDSITEDAAEGRVKAVYDDLRDSTGIVPNVFKVLSIWPEGLELYVAMFKTMMLDNTSLTRVVKEMIAATVSRLNQCDYCLGHHQNFMTQYGISSEISEQVVNDPQTAEISDGEKKLLTYVEKMTRHAYKVLDADIEALKKVGWTHEQILEATLICALFNALNRFADALGVQPEA